MLKLVSITFSKMLFLFIMFTISAAPYS